jgi:enoyl-CoA hydratase
MAIHYEKNGHIVTITIDRYERRNAMDIEHSATLFGYWERFRDDPDAWVAIITGVKNAFCAGGDLGVMENIAKEFAATGTSALGDKLSNGGKGVWTLKAFELYKPIIAAVNGYCMAGGMEMLMGTDIRIASENAVFSVTEPRRGLMAAGGTTARMPRQLSWTASMELLLLAGHISAQRALQLQLINQIVPQDKLMDTAMAWAREVIKNAPLSVQNTKKSAFLGLSAGSLTEAYRIEDAIGELVCATEDAQEGTRAFLEKREPVWKGR